MSDIVERLRGFASAGAGVAVLIDAAVEIERLRERLGPRGLEVVEIDGAGHYVNEKVKAEIERLRNDPLSHDDLCILSRIYNDRESPVPHGTNFRINEWLKEKIAEASKERPFYGAECGSYPNCKGGCGLGCTHDIETRRCSSSVPNGDRA